MPVTAPDLTKPLEPGLYVVSTPIGNLRDITLRALDVLAGCDLVLAEDTRTAARLLSAYGLSAKVERYDDHTGERARPGVLKRLAEGARIALTTDAGTPLVSDPGYRLVREARAAGIPVTTLPGPCAAVAGLTLSGLPNDRFLFAGFLPVKDKARSDMLGELARVPATLVFYETAPRLTKALAAIERVLPGREVAVARELTKLHEECRIGSPADLAEHYAAHPPKGEIVLLVAPPMEREEGVDADAMLREALADQKPSQAAAQVAKATGLDRKALYARALELRGE